MSAVGKTLVRIEESGVYETLLSKLHLEEEEDYKNYLRITPECLEELFELIKGVITKKFLQISEMQCHPN